MVLNLPRFCATKLDVPFFWSLREVTVTWYVNGKLQINGLAREFIVLLSTDINDY